MGDENVNASLKTLEEINESHRQWLENREGRWGPKEQFEQTEAERTMWEALVTREQDEIQKINERLKDLYKQAGTRFERDLRLTNEQGKEVMKAVLNGHGFTGKNYCIAGTNTAEVLNDVVSWAICDSKNSKLDLGKGICFHGDIGRGKTQMLKFLQSFCKAIGFREFDMVHLKSIVLDVSDKRDLGPLKKYTKGRWGFNDIGIEEDDRLFSNKIDVVDRVLSIRADDNLLTHSTTNIPRDKWEEVYGKRVASRAEQLFNFVEMKGLYDFRKDDWKKSINK